MQSSINESMGVDIMQTFLMTVAALCMSTGFSIALYGFLNPMETRK